MIILLEILLLIVGSAVALAALFFAVFRKPEKKTEEASPEKRLRTHGLAKFWYEHGCPSEIGTLIEVNMQSGRVAIYELVKVEPALGVDWSWYEFEFVRYKDSATGPQDSPVYPRD